MNGSILFARYEPDASDKARVRAGQKRKIAAFDLVSGSSLVANVDLLRAYVDCLFRTLRLFRLHLAIHLPKMLQTGDGGM